jgi:M6 family metalloprotease-like protein
LDIRTTHIPANTGAVISSFVANHPRNHFRPHNATTNPDGYRNDNERATREWSLLRDAIDWVRIHNPIPAGLNIDNNGDGYADLVNFVIQGNSEGWNDLLWAHKWALQTMGGVNYETVISGNIRVRDYTLLPENQTSVRTLCHEVFHVLGAPDLYRYDTVHNHIAPTGRWDIMETGFGHMLAHMKIKYGKWISSDIPEITQAGTYTLLSQGKNSTRNVFRIPGNAQEYFLLEYRQRTDDSYELNLPGSGLIATRINPNMRGSAQFNGTSVLDEVFVLRPGGTVTSNGAIASANLSDRTGRTALSKDHATTPFFSNGTMANFLIYNIVDFGDSIQFSFLPRAVSDPRDFFGRWRGDSVFLHWTPSVSYKNVVLIYDTLPILDLLVNDMVYQIGDVLPSGATVLYTGNDSSFIHRSIELEKTYYYRLFTNADLFYMRGVNARVETFLDTIVVFDTIHNFLPIDLPNNRFGIYSWSAPNGGFVSGHNSFSHPLFIEFYRNNTTRRVAGLMCAIGYAVDMSSGAGAYLHVWDVGSDGLPGRRLAEEKIPYASLTAGRWNTLYFENPPVVKSDFFIGFSIEYRTPRDTFAVFTTHNDNTRPIPTAYIFHNNAFIALTSFASGFNAGFAYRPILSSGGLYLTSLPQWLSPPAAGAQNLIVDVFSTYPDYEVISNDDWIYFSVDGTLDRIFVDVDPTDVDRVGEILIIAENDTNRVFVFQGASVSVQKSEEMAVILFPNPSMDGIFYLQSDGGEMQLDVFDLMGRNVWSRRTFSTGEKIDLSRQRNGMYLLRIIKNGQQKTFRLIKQ